MFRDVLAPVTERLSSILPKGNADAALHRGARRHARRWSLDAEVELVSPGRGSGMAINASVGGLRIALDRGVPLDEVCTLRVRTAPDRETIEHARVVWSKAQPDGFVLGLAFVEPSLA
ncbi:MAG: PilZ domain-containing protein [Myxococcota bacterium]